MCLGCDCRLWFLLSLLVATLLIVSFSIFCFLCIGTYKPHIFRQTSLPSWFHSHLRIPSGYHGMDKNCFNSHWQKIFFSKSCSSFPKFRRNVFLFHSQNIGISNWQLWSSKISQLKILMGGLANVFACSRIEDCIAVFGNDYQICDTLLEQIPTLGELDKINIMSNGWK